MASVVLSKKGMKGEGVRFVALHKDQERALDAIRTIMQVEADTGGEPLIFRAGGIGVKVAIPFNSDRHSLQLQEEPHLEFPEFFLGEKGRLYHVSVFLDEDSTTIATTRFAIINDSSF